MSISLVKILSGNDIGVTGGHQAGILVPRIPQAIEFFPTLATEVNPRARILFIDEDTEEPLELTFIHYNGKLYGTSTRNEYRLTGMTRFLRTKAARPGDELQFSKESGRYSISFRRASASAPPTAKSSEADIIVLSGAWVTIQKGKIA